MTYWRKCSKSVMLKLELNNNSILYNFCKCKIIIRIDQNNATFNNISVISWQSVLLMEETGVPGENHRLATSHWQTLSHNAVYKNWVHHASVGFKLTTLVVIGPSKNSGTICQLLICNVISKLFSSLDICPQMWRT
jgi:hypothetical protein